MPPAGLSSGSSGGAYGAPMGGGYATNPSGAGMAGGPYPYGGMPAGGYGAYGAYAAPSPYGMPMGQMPGPGGMYPQAPGGTPYGAVQAGQTGQMGPYPSAALGQQPMPAGQQQPGYPAGFPQQQQQSLGGVGSMGGLAPVSAPPPSGYGTAAAAAPEVVLSPTNPFASVPAGGAGGTGSNPFSAGPAAGAGSSNVDQEWNAFFARCAPGGCWAVGL
jgi:hypothetical protein